MKRAASTIALAGLFAVSVSANSITIYFGQPETVPPTTAFVGGPDPTSLVAPWVSTVTLGIWANVECDISDPSNPMMDTWNGIALNIVGDGVTVTNLIADNFDHRIGTGTAYRWEPPSDLFGGDDGIYLVSVTKFGLGGLWAREWDMGNGSTDWWTYTTGTVGEPGAVYRYWLGNVTLSHFGNGSGDVYFQIGTGGISRQGGTTADWIFFGEGEPFGLHGNQFGAISSQPDFIFYPEPSGLLLIGIAALAMRRR